ncbi:MAG: hypothetical protein A3J65_03535 [Candidatus Buchananbacteria bacterium RIFCSPHIGHO2_02_FULL_45_11b]|uniref:CBS domain-containing protein n=3 Tax=Candidatus Buchananiibacteriota TaxID=1817903 RepID=A0A1G1YC54_9BACT|nr:MAG: hypothetical protein A2663_04295 [Candidatus Buchananbacteria bacterium RIFCSPHIGHO2_01_FULL_46_12]OGY49831.1 MAG: hypothetical protein A3J65_03535 [Candidatus Buchananbacteria bacterium RIFCSPHIGHO2_02_FULL_45_11b]OGY57420.1 MAG: hypothetical protein A3H67_03620 [Candidatus Buchananbacteria bacterium RIFCSPLOWO2_02_FULL_46_11b]
MKIKDVMRKKIYTVSPEATLKEAVAELLKYEISGLIVVNEKNEVLGVVSEKDVYRTLYPTYEEFYNNPEIYIDFDVAEKEINHKAEILVKDFMTTNVVKVSPDEPVMKVGSLMLTRNIHRFPVVDENGQLVGVVSRGHIFRSLFKKYLKPEPLLKKLWLKSKKSGTK